MSTSNCARSIPLKQWRFEEAMREGVGAHSIMLRIIRGRYPDLKLSRVNARVVFVVGNENAPRYHPGASGRPRKVG